MALHDFTNFLNSNLGSMSFNYGFGDFLKPNFNAAQGGSLFECYMSFLQPDNKAYMNSSSIYNNFFKLPTPDVFSQNLFGNMPNFYNNTSTQFFSNNINFGGNIWRNNFLAVFNSTTQNSNEKKSTKKLPVNNSSLSEYNSEKGKKLSTIALKNKGGSGGKCATYVKQAIDKAGLGKYEQGHAYAMDEILAKNPNFKEISIDGINVDDLPAGCVLVFEKGVEGYNKKYGHTEITTGDGRAVSDIITTKIRQPSHVFIPV